MGAGVSVAVVDDHVTFGELLERALSLEPDLTCVGTARDVAGARQLIEAAAPDVVVMDVHLGADDGLELTRWLTDRYPQLRVAVLTAHTDRQVVRRAAAAGACALLPKDGSLAEVLRVIRSAPAGGFTVHPSIMRTLARDDAGPVVQLTDRELDVLTRLRQGLSVRQIARELGISEHTTRGYVKKLLVKLDAHSQLEAVAVATRRGLL